MLGNGGKHEQNTKHDRQETRNPDVDKHSPSAPVALAMEAFGPCAGAASKRNRFTAIPCNSKSCYRSDPEVTSVLSIPESGELAGRQKHTV